MLDSFKLNDTEQTKRMKNLVLGDAYVNTEMYKLLNYENLHKLVVKIPKGELKLSSDLVYGKYTITKEEKFLENLDHYISYVKNHYFIDSMELTLLIELSLGNKYSDILFSLNDFHKEENYLNYFDKYRKMFFYNFYSNIIHYSKYVSKDSSIIKMKNYLENLDYDDETDILLIEKIFKKVIENRNNNIYNSFVSYKEVKRKEYDFYICQVDWILDEYYNNNTIEPFVLTNSDNVLTTLDGTKIVFNINDNILSLDEDDEVHIDFGIKNNNFDCISRNITFRKKEFINLVDRLKNIKDNDNYEEEYTFIDATLRLLFWCDRSEEFLDIEFNYRKDCCDFYSLALGQNEIEELYKLISKQV